MIWITFPETEATLSLLLVNVTANPEVAVAFGVISGSPALNWPVRSKLIVWAAFLIIMMCVTSAAGLKVSSPGCDAVTVTTPAPLIVTVWPFISAIEGSLDEKTTVRPEEEVALSPNAGSPKTCSSIGANVMVWSAFETESVTWTSSAAL